MYIAGCMYDTAKGTTDTKSLDITYGCLYISECNFNKTYI